MKTPRKSNRLVTESVQRRDGNWEWRLVRSGNVLNHHYASASKARRALASVVKAFKTGEFTWPPRRVARRKR